MKLFKPIRGQFCLIDNSKFPSIILNQLLTGRVPKIAMFTRTYNNVSTVQNPVGRPVYGQGVRVPHNNNMASGSENSVFQVENRHTGSSYGQPFSKQQYAKPLAQKNDFGNFQENLGASTSTSVRKSDDVSSFRVERSKSNSLGFMGVPKPRAYSSSVVSNQEEESPKRGRVGESENEKVIVLTGTVERVIKYGKIFRNQFCYYQVIGSVLSIAEGKVNFEKTMLLRDQKGGPILQLTYYSNSTHINIDDFFLGQNLRAFGRMIGPNVMSALSIRAATEQELANLPRMCYISDYAISAICGDVPKA